MELKQAIEKHFNEAQHMQVATFHDEQPWVCTVYFVHDDALNLYWLSWPERRHSQEIAKNSRVAVAIAVKPDMPVIGVQGEGKAAAIKDIDIIEYVMAGYIKKYGLGKDFVRRFKAGTNHHQLYRFIPARYVLFDEQNVSGSAGSDAQQILTLQ